MLKEFWERKKHIIQLTGILGGVGALFLSIPAPIDEKAKMALINIQFVWLMVIFVSAVAILIQLLLLAISIEKVMERKGFGIGSFMTLATAAGTAYFIFNLWQYIRYFQNASSTFWLSGIIDNSIMGILSIMSYYLCRKIILKFNRTKWHSFATIFLPAVFCSVVVAIILFFIINNASFFPTKTWILESMVIYDTILIIMVVFDLYRRYKNK